jgi:hypothetical protein
VREEEMTRDEHLDWAKKRALAYVDSGDTKNAFASFLSDLGKHDETLSARRVVGELGMALMIGGHLNAPAKMREFIEGTN